MHFVSQLLFICHFPNEIGKISLLSLYVIFILDDKLTHQKLLLFTIMFVSLNFCDNLKTRPVVMWLFFHQVLFSFCYCFIADKCMVSVNIVAWISTPVNYSNMNNLLLWTSIPMCDKFGLNPWLVVWCSAEHVTSAKAKCDRQTDRWTKWYICLADATKKCRIICNKRPKGPHIVHLSTMCNLFDRSARAEIFVYSSVWKTQTW